MKATTLKALNSSIKHWREMYKQSKTERPYAHPLDCALCGAFNPLFMPGSHLKSFDEAVAVGGCVGCPVQAKTGKPCCNGTPYWDFEDAPFDASLEEVRPLIKAELDFLISLRPKPVKKKTSGRILEN